MHYNKVEPTIKNIVKHRLFTNIKVDLATLYQINYVSRPNNSYRVFPRGSGGGHPTVKSEKFFGILERSNLWQFSCGAKDMGDEKEHFKPGVGAIR